MGGMTKLESYNEKFFQSNEKKLKIKNFFQFNGKN